MAMVNHNLDQIKTIGQGQTRDEIHQDGGERGRYIDSEGGQTWNCGVSINLGWLTQSTPHNKFVKISGHTWPPIIPLE